MATTDTSQKAVILASFLILSAEASFAGVSALVKFISQDQPFEQLVFFRNLTAFLVLLPWLWRKGPGSLKTTRLGLHLIRAAAGITAMYLFFFAIASIPLAQATLVLLLSPFLIPIIGWLWLKDYVARQTWLAIALGFVGVFIFLDPMNSELSPVIAVAFLAAALAAFTKTVIRRMSSTESTSKIVFYFSTLATIASGVPLLWLWEPIPSHHWLGVFALGLLAVYGQLAMTKAFSIAPPAKVGVFTYSSVIFAALLGFWLFDEALAWHMLWGALIIFVAGYFAIRSRRKS
ncbi:multidrug DMT transporter permease [Idiomarina piscisalsi]|jgi:drug/metabolite transporter (DMT)-like permease|uniref:Multidrug DMT transporter permease n=1 Tax=Idiomarina piscisalsi TaxID=1096243 RepID=A0ABM6LU05_9GAMM|nr:MULTISPECIES: DMT family transporter [Idiomarina]ASG66101.1 multidrug DMT transporter permease [Idiomarina piscisalsi]RXS44129.1 DMT family transporter [Idiomarina sp. 29L]